MRLTPDEFCRRLAIARRIGLPVNVPSESIQNAILAAWGDGELGARKDARLLVQNNDTGDGVIVERWTFFLEGVECHLDLPT